ncbi:undecaprenyl-diphosphate phosphatase [Tepidimonas taiwanensis]|uniref:Undecaprenyl-diphosphatase n=1 Tax=Tepidimonas taiwanensis TaxID=307486 RepID=A0A554XBG3_9BURK|nr:undecaprenyl-diphosphate phosphatase [Tepidimonas taiwanensis]MDM7462919.1 undecaprenyl-diphosphate phosphatase [Tepidimonas taiwanensis]TSE33175.1 Undecaprenyl-diphosphatase [Tepidimonas taiwanensis]UBQ05926.1 undecaprenyl-diphosphate phosphatase [Tepidimonas taiwanensis]
MDVTLLLKAALLGVVEGLTEFLPVSSTGHLILAATLLGLHGETIKVFEVVIQTGAILAIVGLYWQRLIGTLKGLPREPAAQRFTAHVLLGFAPAAVAGFLFIGPIKALLFNAWVVAAGFIVGGVLMLWVEAWRARRGAPRVADVEHLTWRDALGVGLIQCAALVPGVSRSGATIIGGMALGLSRRAATEFSFFLAIPMLFGAAAYDLYKHRALLAATDVPLFAVGLVTSFVAAWVCVKWLLRYVATHTFVPFAWYRIAFGGLVLLSGALGWVQWTP